jgi:hypothetical protein
MKVKVQMYNQGTIRADRGYFSEAYSLSSDSIHALTALLAKFTSAYTSACLASQLRDLKSDYFSLPLVKLKASPQAFSTRRKFVAGGFRICFAKDGQILHRQMTRSESTREVSTFTDERLE